MPMFEARDFFLSDWRLIRRIIDRRAGEIGRLEGLARFSPCDGGAIAYREVGRLKIGAYEGEASRDLLHHMEGAEVRTTYTDGRHFYALDLTDGACEFLYLCAPDRYRGRVCVHGRDLWTQSWRIEGPRKDQRILSLYERGR